MSELTTNPIGRPTKYEPRFCHELEDFMGKGYSATAFAGHIGVSRATIDNWANAHSDFLEALTRAKAKRLLHWEDVALKVAKDGGGAGSASVITFGLRNMGGDEWQDVQRSEITGKDGAPIQTENKTTVDLSAATTEQLRVLASLPVHRG